MAMNSDSIVCENCSREIPLEGLAPFSQAKCPGCGAAFTVPVPYHGYLLQEWLGDHEKYSLYLGVDPAQGQPDIVKILRLPAGEDGGLLPESRELRDRFLDALRESAGVAHPSLVPVLACGEDPRGAYAVTAGIQGDNLHERIRTSDLPSFPEVLKATRQLLAVLQHLDGLGIRHGHLVPENILIGADGNYLLSDFGLAAAIGKDQTAEIYCSPERRLDPAPTLVGDVFSLGVCLYEFCTGILPCAGHEDLWLQGRTAPLALHEVRSDVPRLFSDLVIQMLSLAPESRPPSYGIMLLVLQDIPATPPPLPGGGRRVLLKQARPPGGPAPASAPVPGGARPRPAVAKAPWHSSSTVVPVLVLLAVALVLGLGACLGARRNRRLAGGKTLQLPENLRRDLEDERNHRGEYAAVKEKAPPRPVVHFKLPADVLAARPRPRDYDFKKTREKNQAYLRMVPEDMRAAERERFRDLANYLEYLGSKIMRIPYEPEDGRIPLRNGKTLLGTVPFADGRGVKVRRKDIVSDHTVFVAWHELAPKTLWTIAAYYIEHDRQHGSRLTERKRQELFKEYLYLLCFCDWYQDRESFRLFRDQALELWPEGIDRLHGYFPDEQLE